MRTNREVHCNRNTSQLNFEITQVRNFYRAFESVVDNQTFKEDLIAVDHVLNRFESVTSVMQAMHKCVPRIVLSSTFTSVCVGEGSLAWPGLACRKWDPGGGEC